MPDDERASHCSVCQLPGMALLNVSRRCVGCGEKVPSYGVPGSAPTHCATCGKAEGLSALPHHRKKCEKCSSIASYGWAGGDYLRCFKCKEDGMENLRTKGCGKCNKGVALYGKKGG
jgi:hypothetical protein